MTRGPDGIATLWLGRQRYQPILEAQRAWRQRMIHEGAPEQLWALEHERVITTGKRGPGADLNPDLLAYQGVELVQTERGGLSTWHGPGQLVVYTLVRVHARGFGPKAFVEALEGAVSTWLGAIGLPADRRSGRPGVWVADEKVAAIGLHIAGGVAMHGLALNLQPKLDDYRLFAPCGYADTGVSSVAAILGDAPSPMEAAPSLCSTIIDAISKASLSLPASEAAEKKTKNMP